MMRFSIGLVSVLVACGGGADPLDDASDIPTWANSSSAMGAYELVREPVAFFDDAGDYPDPACPSRSKDATGATFVGDCTDSEGRVWTGTATVSLSGATITVELDEFGNDAFGGAIRASGVVTIEEVGPDEHEFDVDVTTRGGITTTVLYSGSVEGGYTGPTVWNGSGQVRKTGDFFNEGTIAAETVDQVRDNDQCPGEGLSGTTTMTSTEHVVVITYDGESDCDSEHSAQWNLDGADQGTIEGITCSAGGAAEGGMLLLVIGGLLVRRKRQR